MNTEMYSTLSYSKPIKIKKILVNIENTLHIKKKYNEYDYIRNNINEIINIDEINNEVTEINNKCIFNTNDYVFEIYDLKENFFNPDKSSPPNSWKSRLIERIEKQN